MSATDAVANVPLLVNCEQALLKTSVLKEAVFLCIKQKFCNLFLLPIWLLRGKSELICKISERTKINWHTVPVIEVVAEKMRAAEADNRQVYLLTSIPATWGHELCAAINCSKTVVIDAKESSSLVDTNLFAQGFDYIGDGRRDLHFCHSARRVMIVGAGRGGLTSATKTHPIESFISRDKANFFTYLKVIRVHQWMKNLLVWVPLLAAHKLTSVPGLKMAVTAFVAFSFCASSVYVLNDLLDVESDRQHVRKRFRPIAAGTISVGQALLVGTLLFIVGGWLASRVSALFALTLGIYFLMTSAYSFRLKRQVIVDVMLLAALYTIRVIAGAVATSVVPSFWLLAFSMFLFLSLAVVKRYSEMLVTLSQDKQYASGRGYSVQDLPVLLSLGVSAGVAAIVVLALFINDPSTGRLYPSTIWLWPLPPLILYWISRVWMKAHRGEMHDDPVVFAILDWQSLVIAALGGLCFATAAFSINLW